MKLKRNFLFLLGCVCLSTFAFSVNLNLADFPADYPSEGHPFWSLHGQVVQVRGFWYPLSENRGVLAAQSGLKSCCLAAPTKINQQVIVKGGVASLPLRQVVILEGVFKIEPLYNQKGEMIQFYTLDSAKEIERPTSYFLFFFLGGGLCLAAIWNRKFIFKLFY